MILFILYAVLFTFLSWRQPFGALVLIIAFLPSYLIRFSTLGIPMTFLELMVLILFFTWLIKSIIKKSALASSSFKINLNFIKTQLLKINYPRKGLILTWLLIATIAVIVSPNIRAGLGIWKAYFIEPILFFIVFVNLVNISPKESQDTNSSYLALFGSKLFQNNSFTVIFYALGFSALYISLFAIYQKFTGFAIPNLFWQAETSRRVTSIFGYPNAVGLYLAPIIVLYLGKLFVNHKLSIVGRVAYCILSILALSAIIFARSQGAVVGILAGLVFLFFFNWDKKKTLIILFIFILLIFTLPLTRNYVLPIITFQDESGPIRLEMWKETLQMLRDRPLFGAGLAGYQDRVAHYHQAEHIEIYLYPHNIFLNFWSELGLAGLIIFLWIVIKFYKTGFKELSMVSGQWSMVGLMSAMTAILVHGLVDIPYFKNDLSIIFWLLIGIMEVLTRRGGRVV